MYPRYTYPPLGALELAVDVLYGGRRYFRADSKRCIERLSPPLRVFGEENIPQSGPCLITFNHYYRRGFHAWWLALAVAALVPVEMHWIMTGELTYAGKWYAPLGRVGSRWLLRRFSAIYGHITMPPMPPRPKDVEARARAVRQVLSYVREHPDAILGLAPEGSDHPGGALCWPPQGVGRFILLLAGSGFRIVPAGAYEEAGEFCLRFGQAFELNIRRGSANDEKDRMAARIVMENIARQLPARLRGEFGEI